MSSNSKVTSSQSETSLFKVFVCLREQFLSHEWGHTGVWEPEFIVVNISSVYHNNTINIKVFCGNHRLFQV